MLYRHGKDERLALEKRDATEEVVGAAADYLRGYFGLQPIETAPRDGRYVLLAGPSGYSTTPLRFEACRYDVQFRPRQPWVNHSGDSFLDGGDAPTHWMPLPSSPPMRTGDVDAALASLFSGLGSEVHYEELRVRFDALVAAMGRGIDHEPHPGNEA